MPLHSYHWTEEPPFPREGYWITSVFLHQIPLTTPLTLANNSTQISPGVAGATFSLKQAKRVLRRIFSVLGGLQKAPGPQQAFFRELAHRVVLATPRAPRKLSNGPAPLRTFPRTIAASAPNLTPPRCRCCGRQIIAGYTGDAYINFHGSWCTSLCQPLGHRK